MKLNIPRYHKVEHFNGAVRIELALRANSSRCMLHTPLKLFSHVSTNGTNARTYKDNCYCRHINETQCVYVSKLQTLGVILNWSTCIFVCNFQQFIGPKFHFDLPSMNFTYFQLFLFGCFNMFFPKYNIPFHTSTCAQVPAALHKVYIIGL